MNKQEMVYQFRNYSVRLEQALKQNGANGQGVKALVESIDSKLPSDLQNKIFECNRLRNKVMHEQYDPSMSEYQRYQEKMDNILKQLNNLNKPKSSSDMETIIAFGLVFVVGYVLYHYWQYILAVIIIGVIIGCIYLFNKK